MSTLRVKAVISTTFPVADSIGNPGETLGRGGGVLLQGQVSEAVGFRSNRDLIEGEHTAKVLNVPVSLGEQDPNLVRTGRLRGVDVEEGTDGLELDCGARKLFTEKKKKEVSLEQETQTQRKGAKLGEPQSPSACYPEPPQEWPWRREGQGGALPRIPFPTAAPRHCPRHAGPRRHHERKMGGSRQGAALGSSHGGRASPR